MLVDDLSSPELGGAVNTDGGAERVLCPGASTVLALLHHGQGGRGLHHHLDSSLTNPRKRRLLALMHAPQSPAQYIILDTKPTKYRISIFQHF